MNVNHPKNKAYRIGLESVGSDVFIWELAQVVFPEHVSVCDSTIFDDFVFITGTEDMKTRIGSFVHIGSHAYVGAGTRLEDFSGLSGGVRIYTGNEEYLGGCLTNPTVPAPYRIATKKPVVVRKHAIIGANAVVLPGVTIGEGAVVGSLSFVTKDIEPWTINVGNPIKTIRTRRSDKILELEEQLRNELYADGKYLPRFHGE